MAPADRGRRGMSGLVYGSVCSGIEAASVAWHPLGWRCAFVSEIDPFPCAVLQYHYPAVPNYGDLTRYREWPDAALDVLVGGTPCQSFSVAGLRRGLADPRGNLALVFLGLVDRYRPRWVVWENVPGVLSSNRGRDVGAFLGGLAELGYGWAYRVLDAQYVRVDGFGRAVPQRRRRVFVVGCAGDWRGAAAVLFERESLCGHTPPRRTAGQAAPTVPGRRTAGGGLGTDFDCDGGLICMAHSPQLTTGGGKPGEGQCSGVVRSALYASQAVRRLVVEECEALQGFPRDYTLIPYRGKPAADGPRYKALGNSMAVNCMRWLGWRIQMVDDALWASPGERVA